MRGKSDWIEVSYISDSSDILEKLFSFFWNKATRIDALNFCKEICKENVKEFEVNTYKNLFNSSRKVIAEQARNLEAKLAELNENDLNQNKTILQLLSLLLDNSKDLESHTFGNKFLSKLIEKCLQQHKEEMFNSLNQKDISNILTKKNKKGIFLANIDLEVLYKRYKAKPDVKKNENVDGESGLARMEEEPSSSLLAWGFSSMGYFILDTLQAISGVVSSDSSDTDDDDEDETTSNASSSSLCP